jgi:hypothetical protein
MIASAARPGAVAGAKIVSDLILVIGCSPMMRPVKSGGRS